MCHTLEKKPEKNLFGRFFPRLSCWLTVALTNRRRCRQGVQTKLCKEGSKGQRKNNSAIIVWCKTSEMVIISEENRDDERLKLPSRALNI